MLSRLVLGKELSMQLPHCYRPVYDKKKGHRCVCRKIPKKKKRQRRSGQMLYLPCQWVLVQMQRVVWLDGANNPLPAGWAVCPHLHAAMIMHAECLVTLLGS